MFDDEDKVEDKKKEKKEKEKESVNSYASQKKSGTLIKIKNRSGQRQTLDFKRIHSIRVNAGETTELTPEQFESDYFKNRAKYFSVVKEA